MTFVTLQGKRPEHTVVCDSHENAVRALDALGMHMNSAVVTELTGTIMLYYEAIIDTYQTEKWVSAPLRETHFGEDLLHLLKEIFAPFVIKNEYLRNVYSVEVVRGAGKTTSCNVDLVLHFNNRTEILEQVKSALSSVEDSHEIVQSTYYCLD